MVASYQSEALTITLWIYPELQAMVCTERLKVCNLSADRNCNDGD